MKIFNLRKYILNRLAQDAQEIIEIDGKKYHEIDGQLVEIPLHPPKTITFYQFDPPVSFTEGQIYSDFLGHYKLNKISEDDKYFDIVYIDGDKMGQKRQYESLSRAIIIHREQKRQDQINRMKTLGFSGNKEYFTLGYLAAKGIIIAQVPYSQAKWFEDMYHRLTGDNAQTYLNINALYRIEKDESKYSLELRIKFPEPEDQYLSQMQLKYININKTAHGLEINNNDFIKNLFKMGFKIGNNTNNLANIRNHIPENMLNDFNAGAQI